MNATPRLLHVLLFVAVVAASAASRVPAADDKPTPIAAVKHEGPVHFEKEILPFLKKNCTACHNASKAESDLVLETPQSILKGGAGGPGLVAGNGAESLLVTRAAANDDEAMPPKDNKVGASHLTSQQLGLLKLWIDQGATGEVGPSEQIVWQPLPAGVNPIYAVVLTPDGQYALCSRANQIFAYHLPTGRLLERLTDPALLKSGIYDKPGVADLDLVQSLAISPDGLTLASGGFRTIKLWRREESEKSPLWAGALKSDAINLVAAAADGKLFAFVQGAEVQLADVAANKLSAKLTGHKGAISGVAFTLDGAKVATVAADKSLRLWNAADGKQLAEAELPAAPTAVAFLADAKTLIVGGSDGKLLVFAAEPPDGKLAAAADKKESAVGGKRVTALAAMPNNAEQFVSADEKGGVSVWTIGKTSTSKVIQKSGGEVTSLSVRADGGRIAVLGLDNAVRVWNVSDGKVLGESSGDVRATRLVAALARSVTVAKGQAAAEKGAFEEAEKTAKAEAEAAKKAEEAKTAAEKTLKEKSEAADKALAEKQKAEQAVKDAEAAAKKADEAKAAADKAVAEAEAAEKAATEQLAEAKKNAKDKPADLKKAEQAQAAAAAKTKAAADAQKVAVKEATDAAAKAKAAPAALEKTAKPLEDAEKAKAEAESVLKSSDRAIASTKAASQRTADAVPAAKKLADLAAEAQKRREAELEAAKTAAAATAKPFRAAVFSPDGGLLAVVGDDALVHTYDAETVQPLDVLVGHAKPTIGVAFIGDDRAASVAADGSALAWQLHSEWKWARTIGDPQSTTLVDRVTALDFSPDGKLLASGGGLSRSGELKIWNLADGTLVREIAEAHSDTVFAVRFSPDGTKLASGAADKFLKTFTVADGKLIRGYEGHTHHVLGVAWSADGRILASAGADNVVKGWDFATGEQKKTVQGFTKEVTSVTFVGEGTDCVVTSGDKTVRLLKADTGQMGKQLGGAKDFVYCAAVTIDGKTVAAGGQDGVLRLWDVEKGSETKTFAPPADATNQQAQK